LVLFIVSDDETLPQLMERGFSSPQHPEAGNGAGVECAGLLAHLSRLRRSAFPREA
jgi:hypothetical protein